MKFIILLSILIFLSTCSSTQTVKERFTVDLRSHQIPMGTIDAQFDSAFSFGGLRKNDIIVSYFPVEDAVCLQYKNDFITYYVFWNKVNRIAFLRALENYKEDYNQRNFGKSSRKSKDNYEKVNGYLIWQSFSFTVQANGHPDIGMGYYFKNKAPYFTIFQHKAYFHDLQSKQKNRQSTEITIYFTRAQADNLAAIFNTLYLQEYNANIIFAP